MGEKALIGAAARSVASDVEPSKTRSNRRRVPEYQRDDVAPQAMDASVEVVLNDERAADPKIHEFATGSQKGTLPAEESKTEGARKPGRGRRPRKSTADKPVKTAPPAKPNKSPQDEDDEYTLPPLPMSLHNTLGNLDLNDLVKDVSTLVQKAGNRERDMEEATFPRLASMLACHIAWEESGELSARHAAVAAKRGPTAKGKGNDKRKGGKDGKPKKEKPWVNPYAETVKCFTKPSVRKSDSGRDKAKRWGRALLVCAAFWKPEEVEERLTNGEEIKPGKPNTRKKGFALCAAKWNHPEVKKLREADNEDARNLRLLQKHFAKKIINDAPTSVIPDVRISGVVADDLGFEAEQGEYAVASISLVDSKLHIRKLNLKDIDILRVVKRGTTDPKGEDAAPPTGVYEFGSEISFEDEVDADFVEDEDLSVAASDYRGENGINGPPTRETSRVEEGDDCQKAKGDEPEGEEANEPETFTEALKADGDVDIGGGEGESEESKADDETA